MFKRYDLHILIIPLYYISPFSIEWFFWLAASGISIGMVVSVKWVGLFAIALVGLHTVEDLWESLGDLSLSAVCALRFTHLTPSPHSYVEKTSSSSCLSSRFPHHNSYFCLLDCFCLAFRHFKSLWTRRRWNEFSFPGWIKRKRL